MDWSEKTGLLGIAPQNQNHVVMEKFKVMLEGRNLHLDIEGVGKFGVVTVRYVEALDEVIAAHAAMEDFRCEPKGKDLHKRLLNTTDDPPIFEAVEVTEIETLIVTLKQSGWLFIQRSQTMNVGSTRLWRVQSGVAPDCERRRM